MSDIETSFTNCNLELGDIIQLYATNNDEFDQKMFYIMYIDSIKMNLINIKNNILSSVNFDENGNIKDESIEKIVILSRSEEKGYAAQNKLLPKTWIDIHFNGEIVQALTGEITNLEEDMIEITRFPNLDVLYIDFAYQGLPENLDIEKIVIRPKPNPLENIESLVNVKETLYDGATLDSAMKNSQKASMTYLPSGESVISLPDNPEADKSLHEELQILESKSSDIGHGKDLDDLDEEVELSEKEKRYGIETQVNDMLDILLSEIPDEQRSDRVKNEIHLLIQRFRELRAHFSNFDEFKNILSPKINGIGYKPLLDTLLNMNKKIKWILPVVSLKKKIYHEHEMDDDIEFLGSEGHKMIMEEGALQDSYLKSQLITGDKSLYVSYYKKLNDYYIPYVEPSNIDSYIGPKVIINNNIETIVDNLDNFNTTVVGQANNNVGVMRKQYVMQRFIEGNSFLEPKISKTGRKVFERVPMNNNEHCTLKSILFLPKPVIHFSTIDLPETSILKKCKLAENYMYMFKIFNKSLTIDPRIVDDFTTEMDKEFWEIPLNDKTFNKHVQHYILNENIEAEPQKLEKYLNSIIPYNVNIIRLLDKIYSPSQLANVLSIRKGIEKLEPFMTYVQDVNYSQYNSLRFFMKNNRKNYLESLNNKKDEVNKFKNFQFDDSIPFPNRLETIFNEKKDLLDVIMNLYKLTANKTTQTSQNYVTSSEWMSKFLYNDSIVVLSSVLRLLMVSLVTPENLITTLDETTEEDDMNKYEKIKASDCVRRVLTKKYKTLKDLQKDNGNEDTYYDEIYDETPYELLQKYKDEKKKYTPEELQEFFEEVLVQKHDCPPKLAPEMATSILEGKKRVRDGEYAVLEIRPSADDKKEYSEEEKQEIVEQANMLKKTAYYKRINDQWVHDDSVDDTIFLDNNALFCNMSKICFKNTFNNTCENVQDVASKMKKLQRKKILEEFDERFAESFETIEETLRTIMDTSIKKNKARQRLREVLLYKANDFAYEMGKYIKEVDINKSPHIQQLDDILGQDNFVKKQNDIVRFAELYCRDPMVGELNESQYWLYCVETNSQLLPRSLFQLARAFVSNENYVDKLNEICRNQGRIEGNKIVDNYTGRVLKLLDDVDEEMFDEQGFKLISNAVIEKDILEVAVQTQNKVDRVFDNKDSEMIFKLYRSIIGHIGIKTDDIEEFVIRLSLELLNDPSIVKSEKMYKLEAKKIEEQRKKKLPPYEIYRNKFIILIVTSSILIGIQTNIPSFKIQKTFPGCTQSFKGFPENNGAIEDTSGVDYLVCILNTIKTKSAKPWNSIKPLPLEVIKSQLMQLIQQAILPKNEISELYLKKQEYLEKNPELDIPYNHSIEKWKHFMPPTFPIEVTKNLNGIPTGYKEELLELLKTGNKKQSKQLSMYKTKCLHFTYAMVENINEIIKNKGLLLKTGNGIYFTENACCNDKKTQKAIQYFMEENKELIVYLRMVKGWSEILDKNKKLLIAPMIYHPKRTGLTYTSENTDSHFERNVYVAFITYCNLDNDKPIPEDLQVLLSEKIADYPKRASLIEKIEFLKSNGKKFTNGNLLQLLQIVNKRNIVENKNSVMKDNRISAIKDLFSYVQERAEDDDIVLCYKFRTFIGAIFDKYNPKRMISEDSEETYKLNNWLTHANTNLLERITKFISQNSKLKKSEKKNLETQLANVHIWTMDATYEEGSNISQKDETTMYSVIQFMKESMYLMSKVYPEMIKNHSFPSSSVHKHWGLAQEHNNDISLFLENYYNPLRPFSGDRPLNAVLQHVQEILTDVYSFIELLPAFLPIHHQSKDSQTHSYYSLFSKRTLYMIYTYVWYSVLYEYIKATDNEELIQMDQIISKQDRRKAIKDKRDSPFGRSEEIYSEESFEYSTDLEEVQIEAGNVEELKKRVAELLVAFINMDTNNKKSFDLAYSDIEKRIIRSKMNEKKMITDFLKNMDDDQRRVEDMQKMLKLGRWNVGLRKGHVQYDQQRYVEERKELFQQLTMNPSEMNDDVIIQQDVGAIENQEAQDIDDFYENEANDLRDYHGVDADGAYYEEDYDDFGED